MEKQPENFVAEVRKWEMLAVSKVKMCFCSNNGKEMYKKERCTCKVVFLQNIPYTRYPRKYFTQIYRDLYGDAMLVPTWMGTNMADGNQQKHLLPSIGTKE